MKAAAVPTLSTRLARFARWFFTTSPEAALEPWQSQAPPPRSRVVSQRKPVRLCAQHAGPVRVVIKGKP